MGTVRQHRRYAKSQKVAAVIAAEMTSQVAAAEATGIPMTTIDYWMDQPEFVALRKKTREDLAEESKALAHRTLGEIMRRLGEFEPRDLSILYGILTDKAQLLTGAATSRTEHREVTDALDDHERQQLRDLLDEVIRDTAAAHAGD